MRNNHCVHEIDIRQDGGRVVAVVSTTLGPDIVKRLGPDAAKVDQVAEKTDLLRLAGGSKVILHFVENVSLAEAVRILEQL